MKRNNRRMMLFALICSALVLAICSQNSFLYGSNEAASINMYITIGKEMKYGKIPYLDIVDHKGPIQYFIYELIAMISDTGYIGVYIVEILAFGLFLYFFGKTAELYQKRPYVSYCAIGLMSVLTATSGSFFAGNSEELVLWLLAYALYSVLRAIKENRCLSKTDALFNGLAAGIIFWNKYTALGVYVGLVALVTIWYLSDKNLGFKKLTAVSLQFLLGCVIVSVGVIGYFLKHNALNEMMSIYIYWNILYSDGIGIFHSIHAKVADMIYYSCEAVISNIGWAGLVIVGFGWAVFRTKQNWKEGCVALMGLAMQWLAIYLPSRYFSYYALVLAPFSVFGFIAFNDLGEKLVCRSGVSEHSEKWIAVTISLMLSCAVIALKCPSYIDAMRHSHDESVCAGFAEIMNQEDNPTLLVYGVLDNGFYYQSNISPTCKYFCKTNQENPEMIEMQNDFVENGRIQFVVTRYQPLDAYEIDSRKYTCISERDEFYLYKLKQ